MREYSVAVVGATGLVGRTFLKVMQEKRFPVSRLKLFASEKSVGKYLTYSGKRIRVAIANEKSVSGTEIAFFAVNSQLANKIAPLFLKHGVLIIDNSSAFRMSKKVPLIIPEVNFRDYSGERLVSNPNCVTVQSVLPLNALLKYGIKSVNYCTYQAVSGSGIKGINDLKRTLNGVNSQYYDYDIRETCIPSVGKVCRCGYTEEEEKMRNETRKILNLKNLPVSATCIRVPVKNCHGVSVRVELKKKFDLSEIVCAFKDQKGVVVASGGEEANYPVSQNADGNDLVYVGRIRKDTSCKNGLLFYCVSDNLRKGAATNAVQIALKLIDNNYI